MSGYIYLLMDILCHIFLDMTLTQPIEYLNRYYYGYGSFRPGMYNCGKLGPSASLGGCPKRIYQAKMKTHTVVYPYIEESANTIYTQIF